MPSETYHLCVACKGLYVWGELITPTLLYVWGELITSTQLYVWVN